MAGPVPAISRGTLPLRMAGTSPAMTMRAGLIQSGSATAGRWELAMTVAGTCDDPRRNPPCRRRHRTERRSAAHHAHRRQHRRSADPGWQPLPLRGNQPGTLLSTAPPRAASVSTSPPAPRCVSNQARRVKSHWCRIAADAWCRGSAPPSWERSTDGPPASRRLCRHVRPHHRRSRPPRRYRPDRRGGTRPHHLRRGSEVRRRQGDPRRHGPVAGIAGGRRGRYGDHQCADHRSLGHREGRCRDHQRPHREDRQGRQSRHPAECRHHHRPRHGDHRRRGQDPHRRRHRCAYPLHLSAAGGGCDRLRHHHADRRRHRSGHRHRGHHVHAGPVASRAHAAGGGRAAGQSRLRRQGQRIASGRAGRNDPRRCGVPEAARGLGHHARRDRLRARMWRIGSTCR